MLKLAFGLVLSGLALFAQSDRGAITGIVAGPSSAPIPGATVTATHRGARVTYTSSTTESGNYRIPQLPFGRHEFTAEAGGFRRHLWRETEIGVGQTLTLNLTLEMAQAEQQIEIMGNAPAGKSTASDAGAVVSARNAIDLPLAVAGNVLLTFRARCFNALNRVAFAAPEANVNNANFGRIARQANNPRQGRLALRLEF